MTSPSSFPKYPSDAAADCPVTRLETDRLILRAISPADRDGYVAFFTSDRSRFAGGPLERTDAWRWFAAEIGHWRIHGWGMFAVAEKTAPDVTLGIVGPWFPDGWPEREVGWLLWPQGEGRGIAAEAARACLDHVFRDLHWPTAVSYIAPDNHRSIALAERLGAVRDPSARPHTPGDLVYRHAPPRNVRFGPRTVQVVQKDTP
ncbi:N-acetyltransferase GCN5 [Oceaniovalibus guishaninsula JLT2003]|uniref:N-acetyltransferase GCN5 n=1 Tax=Oceaniovalibus guishaninsula JLT2003 TaxID=1231392 RepID=K2HGW4_9RHOB|nr:GNAT family N-acetyltransferase [Oceaniovalibus guishaninsula]EKE45682.1 N-acetyltransferase GCN5 [Oceaniovalibus guishaninsula JLT2003]